MRRKPGRGMPGRAAQAWAVVLEAWALIPVQRALFGTPSTSFPSLASGSVFPFCKNEGVDELISKTVIFQTAISDPFNGSGITRVAPNKGLNSFLKLQFQL